MSDKFIPISMKELSSWIFDELMNKRSIFGIPEEMFFKPDKNDKFKVKLYNQNLDTPFGVAAGPHTQMAQNIIVSWLCGARFIELKTVQTLDELEVSKPCIDILDVGYNVEWSQELRLEQSFDEYLKAWILIHLLHKKLEFPGKKPGIIFNISVGYNLEGILKPNVQKFLGKMKNAGDLLSKYIEDLADTYPEIKISQEIINNRSAASFSTFNTNNKGVNSDLDEYIEIPSQLSDNITLSTMHGCPPDEIGKIASYLIQECGYHTNVKLNPTLLGSVELRRILNEDLGYREITVPDLAFEHDLKYPDAVLLIKDLAEKAEKKGVIFGVKLSNTLEVKNHRTIFNKNEKMMYLSGRPLHAITVNLARKLGVEFDGQLLMSYAGGADCFNVADLIHCGMKTITVSSDLLRPGGYGRMLQYIENLKSAIEASGSSSINNFICGTADNAVNVKTAAFTNLKQYADIVLTNPLLFRDTYERINTKTNRELALFDCIKAPCTDECPINQNVPLYVQQLSEGNIEAASNTIRNDNAIPTILGRACNHQCETKCTRTHYDEPIAIRELKRFIIENEEKTTKIISGKTLNIKTAIIGGGPAGLSLAYFLVQAGCDVTIYEERERAAGMVSRTIPEYRATDKAIANDMKFIENLGVKFKFNCKIGRDITIEQLKKSNDYVTIAVGAQKGMLIGIPQEVISNRSAVSISSSNMDEKSVNRDLSEYIDGENTNGVIDGIEFLHSARAGTAGKLGNQVGVIGAGDVAMDCARVAKRLTNGTVSIIYRRSIEQMPAHKEELDGLIEEGIEIKELCAPKAVVVENGRMKALKCSKMKLGEPDESGRKRPIEIPNSDFELPLDNLITAIGQTPDFDFLNVLPVVYNRKGYIDVDSETMETSVEKIYAIGDAVDKGPQTIVKACGDGKKVAKDILSKSGIEFKLEKDSTDNTVSRNDFIKKRSIREFRVNIPEIEIENRNNFIEIVQTLSTNEAEKEAARCLKCDKYCGTCVSVCPNKALFTYEIDPISINIPMLNSEETELFEVKQKFQTAVFTSFCNECGNCAIFCPTAGKPYSDKVRLYNDTKELDEQSDNAFMVSNNNGYMSIKAKFDNDLYELLLNDKITCSNSKVTIRLDKKTFAPQEIQINDAGDDEVISLKNFATMYFILKGIKDSVPEIPVN